MATAVFKFSFPKKLLGDPLIYTLSKDFKVIPNILKGKVTTESAWLEIQLEGETAEIARAEKYLRDRGVDIEKVG